MRLKNVLVVVDDIQRSIEFYKEIFGLFVVEDNDGNVIMTEGLVLQDRKIWESFLGRDVINRSNSCELYFEEKDIESFIEKLENSKYSIEYVNKLMTHSWGQKVIRFYDPDGNLIEVGTPVQ
ncbi:MAG: glyoxalase [Anaerofustis stercorihominis]|nr:glyoxalase [Anaerofustis stercorihominis]